MATSQTATGKPGIDPLLEPATQQFVDAQSLVGGLDLHTLSPSDARDAFARLQAIEVGKPAVDRIDTVFPVGPHGGVPVRILRPEGVASPVPVIVYFPGGGWVVGDAETHDRLVRELVQGVGAAVVFVRYGRAPETRFPISNEEAYAVLVHLTEAATSLALDASRLAVVGDGAGGNMAAVVSLLAKERRGPKIALQVLFYPVADASLETESAVLFSNGPWLTRSAMEWSWRAYLPDETAGQDEHASLLRAPLDRLRNLPDTLVITAESDLLRDEGESYARRLASAGVRVTSTRYNGTIHDFVVLNAIADTPAARGAIAQSIVALKAALE